MSYSSDEMVVVVADLPLGSIYLLHQLAVEQNINLTEALRRSIATAVLVQRAINNGNPVIIDSECGCVAELNFRH